MRPPFHLIFQPVSYTHLDVYKRQPEDRAYDKVTVTVGADGNATGASVEFIGK